MVEEWRTIPGYEGLYEVSNFGAVRTLERTWVSGKGVVRTVRPGVKRQSFDKDGYPRVTLCKDGVKRRILVHRLVMWAFVGPQPKGIQVRHLDHSKTNNKLNNLCYGTAKENAADMIANPKYRHPQGMKGKQHTAEARRRMSESHKRRIALEV